MSIHYIESDGRFVLETKHTTYQMKTDELGYLRHLYYGARTDQGDLSYRYRVCEHGFSGNPYEMRMNRTFSLDYMPQEYSSFGVGDFRVSSMEAVCSDGSRCGQFLYAGYEIQGGKYQIPGLPSVYDNGGEAQTLIISLQDPVSGIGVQLYYGLFEELDIITRAARILNRREKPIWLEKAASVCLELPYGNWDLIHFHGRHCMERQLERVPLFHGVHTLASARGMSSHQHNPFVILCDREATEDGGICYGMMLVYSGNHKTEVERYQFDEVRAVMGVNNDNFRWELSAGDSFYTPEVILTCSDGLAQLSHRYHHIIRNNVVRGKYKLSHRPVLVNNWEATYFDYNERKLVEIAEKAKELGIELFVLDDGWFKARHDDNAGLGDWVPDPAKLENGLDGLITKVNALGLKFGLWIEPEMVNEDSDLYRAHPDWALQVPGRPPMMGRNQLVLDLSRREVTEYLYETIAGLLSQYKIDYIKWDFNRSMADVYSQAAAPGQQGEVGHRYYLGLYELYDRLTKEFPDVLFEACSGGGGRFDAGMLAYSPQIWCSDNTDPIARLSIQYGTSFAYPACTVGAHVSASPNHQTGRSTPLGTRGTVAMAGTFGYELDLTRLTEEECEEIKEQIRCYKELEPIVHEGKLYRLSSFDESARYAVWQFVSPDRTRSLLSIVVKDPQANFVPVHVRLKGLDSEAMYQADSGMICSGRALMKAGYTFPQLTGDYPAMQILLTKTEN